MGNGESTEQPLPPPPKKEDVVTEHMELGALKERGFDPENIWRMNKRDLMGNGFENIDEFIVDLNKGIGNGSYRDIPSAIIFFRKQLLKFHPDKFNPENQSTAHESSDERTKMANLMITILRQQNGGKIKYKKRKLTDRRLTKRKSTKRKSTKRKKAKKSSRTQ